MVVVIAVGYLRGGRRVWVVIVGAYGLMGWWSRQCFLLLLLLVLRWVVVAVCITAMDLATVPLTTVLSHRHYFCNSCALKEFKKDPHCYACKVHTGGDTLSLLMHW